MFNANAFKGKVVTLGLTLEEMAKKLDICSVSLTRKMQGKTEFTRTEIEKSRECLNLTDAEVMSIFFAS